MASARVPTGPVDHRRETGAAANRRADAWPNVNLARTHRLSCKRGDRSRRRRPRRQGAGRRILAPVAHTADLEAYDEIALDLIVAAELPTQEETVGVQMLYAIGARGGDRCSGIVQRVRGRRRKAGSSPLVAIIIADVAAGPGRRDVSVLHARVAIGLS